MKNDIKNKLFSPTRVFTISRENTRGKKETLCYRIRKLESRKRLPENLWPALSGWWTAAPEHLQRSRKGRKKPSAIASGN